VQLERVFDALGAIEPTAFREVVTGAHGTVLSNVVHGHLGTAALEPHDGAFDYLVHGAFLRVDWLGFGRATISRWVSRLCFSANFSVTNLPSTELR
jgi:hypothetical protein